jgi:hypothetical protein
MSYMGQGHWMLVGLLAFIWLLQEWQQPGKVAPKPFIAAGMLVCTGMLIALLQGDFQKTGFLNFMVFMQVDYASVVIAGGYSLLVFGLVNPIVSMFNKGEQAEEYSKAMERAIEREIASSQYRCLRCKNGLTLYSPDKDTAVNIEVWAGKLAIFVVLFLIIVVGIAGYMLPGWALYSSLGLGFGIAAWPAYRRSMKDCRFYCPSCDIVFLGDVIRSRTGPQKTVPAR